MGSRTKTHINSPESLCVVVVTAVTKVDGLKSVSLNLITLHSHLTGTRDEMEALIYGFITPTSPGFTR